MPRKLRELRKDLRRAGAQVASRVGSHEKWRHPLVPTVAVELAGHDGTDAKPYQEKQVGELLKRVAEAKRRQQP